MAISTLELVAPPIFTSHLAALRKVLPEPIQPDDRMGLGGLWHGAGLSYLMWGCCTDSVGNRAFRAGALQIDRFYRR